MVMVKSLHLSSRFLLYVLTFVALTFSHVSSADATMLSLYKNCILGDDFGDGLSETLTVTPVGKLCNEICNRECNALSRKNGAIEQNGDKITACMKACKKGDTYSTSWLRDTNGQLDGKTYSTGSSCSKSPGSKTYYYYPHDSRVIVKAGENIVIKLKGSTNSVGGVYMCGFQSVTLEPKDASMNYNAMTSYWVANKGNFNNSPATWHSRNPNVTKTDIIFKDGDHLSIEYSGEYRWWCTAGTQICVAKPDDYSLLIKKPNLHNFAVTSSVSDNDFLRLPGGDLQSYIRLDDGSISGYQGSYNANKDVQWLGLYGKFENIYYDKEDPNDDTKMIIDTKGKRVITFEGVVDGFSGTYNNLGLLHYDKAPGSHWDDNLGGLTVTINRVGCLFMEGDRLQYTITSERDDATRETLLEDKFYLPEANDWKDVPKSSSIEYLEFPSYKSGKIWLRIKPYFSSEDAAFYPVCAFTEFGCLDTLIKSAQNLGPGNTGGYYFAEVLRLQDNAFASNVLSDTIRDIRSYFFGADGGGGIVQIMFNNLVANSKMILIIRSLLVLYIAVTGASFMIGIAQFTQREAIIRLISIGLVVTLISPNSWEFFNTNLFQFFINGGLELMANTINYTEYGLPSTAYAQVQEDPALVFTALDKPLHILFGKKTWLKIYALVFSSFVGFIIALTILYAAIIYAVTLIKVMLIYTVSLVMMSILLLLAPIFISFVLFGYTRKMFFTWLQQLMSVTLQPVVIVAGMGIFSTLILIGLYTALGFTVCEGCLFSFYIPFVGMDEPFCYFPAWFTLLSKHSPEGVIFPPLIGVGAAFYFLILAQGSYVFCTDIVQRINQIISGFFLGIDLSGYANIADYTSAYANPIMSAPSYLTAGDKAGMQARRNLKGGIEGTIKAVGIDAVTGLGKGLNRGFKATTGIDVGERAKHAATYAGIGSRVEEQVSFDRAKGTSTTTTFDADGNANSTTTKTGAPAAGGGAAPGGGSNSPAPAAPPAGGQGGNNSGGSGNDDGSRNR